MKGIGAHTKTMNEKNIAGTHKHTEYLNYRMNHVCAQKMHTKIIRKDFDARKKQQNNIELLFI